MFRQPPGDVVIDRERAGLLAGWGTVLSQVGHTCINKRGVVWLEVFFQRFISSSGPNIQLFDSHIPPVYGAQRLEVEKVALVRMRIIEAPLPGHAPGPFL